MGHLKFSLIFFLIVPCDALQQQRSAIYAVHVQLVSFYPIFERVFKRFDLQFTRPVSREEVEGLCNRDPGHSELVNYILELMERPEGLTVYSEATVGWYRDFFVINPDIFLDSEYPVIHLYCVENYLMRYVRETCQYFFAMMELLGSCLFDGCF